MPPPHGFLHSRVHDTISTMRLAPLFLVAALGLAPAQTLLVLNKEGTLAIVDPVARKVLATVRTGDQPHEVAASADGALACVSNYGSGAAGGNTLSVIDLRERKEIQRVNLSPLSRPHGVAMVGDNCWFTAEANKVIGR